MQEAGAQILYDTLVSDVVMDGDTLRGVIVESKSGREALLADVVVDATGDADVAARAGVPIHTRAPGAGHSFCFRLGNVDVDRLVDYFVDHPDQYPDYMDVDWTFEEALAQYRDTGTFLFPHGGAMQMDIFKAARAKGEYPEVVGVHDTLDACQMHALRDKGVVHLITGFAHFDDLDIETITRSMVDGRRMAYVVADFFRGHVPGFDRAFVVGTADDLGIRASRWIDGEFTFTRAMREQPTTFDDAVGRGVVERDVRKHRGERAWGVQTFTDATFDIPYRCLLPRRVEGLLMGAGRSVSAEDPYLLRVMALTMVVGQGAGAAAAIAARHARHPARGRRRGGAGGAQRQGKRGREKREKRGGEGGEERGRRREGKREGDGGGRGRREGEERKGKEEEGKKVKEMKKERWSARKEGERRREGKRMRGEK